jgi:hypothetical protein
MTQLNLHYPHQARILHSRAESISRTKENAIFEAWTYEWIIEFAHYKFEYFPKFQKLHLEDNHAALGTAEPLGADQVFEQRVMAGTCQMRPRSEDVLNCSYVAAV